MQPLRKRFGQHLLVDSSVIGDIINAIYPKENDCIVEIGPGLGALTIPLLLQQKKLIAIEFDRDMIAQLQIICEDKGQLILHQADALRFDFTQLASGHKIRLVGNLPYNISTPLLFHLANQQHVIQDMHFMLQKEVVDRITAEVDTDAYGRLSIMLQLDFAAETLLIVPPAAFNPPPKVYSAVVRLTPLTAEQKIDVKDRLLFADIVRTAFQYKRKTLKNALQSYFSSEKLLELAIDPLCRPAELTVKDYATLANSIALQR